MTNPMHKQPADEAWTDIATLTPEQSEAWEQINVKEAIAQRASQDLMETLVQKATQHAQEIFNAKRVWWKAFADEHGIDIRREDLRIVPLEDGTFKVVKVEKLKPLEAVN